MFWYGAEDTVKVIPIHISREVGAGDDIAALILEGARLLDGDILVVAQKIVSKAEGRMVLLDSVRPGLLARGIAGEYGKDPRVVELVLREATHIVRMGGGVIITRLPSGHICANSGVDVSNVPEGCALPLPVPTATPRRRASGMWCGTSPGRGWE